MNREALISYLVQILERQGYPSSDIRISSIGGGDTHQCVRLRAGEETLFIKFAEQNLSQGEHSVLASEYSSLAYLNKLFPGCYPVARFLDIQASIQCLALNFHNLIAIRAESAELAGKLLAEQHQVTGSQFGWFELNHIGRNEQHNKWSNSWVDFFADQRLMPQLRLAQSRGLGARLVNKIDNMLDAGLPVLTDRTPEISLVHGDLWSGNIAYDVDAQKPFLFDPAPYYGDREVDIAMTRLFGGFPHDFYQSYRQYWPLDEGFAQREPVYNLYHALNHYNLFGRQYEGLIDQLVGQLSFY